MHTAGGGKQKSGQRFPPQVLPRDGFEKTGNALSLHLEHNGKSQRTPDGTGRALNGSGGDDEGNVCASGGEQSDKERPEVPPATVELSRCRQWIAFRSSEVAPPLRPAWRGERGSASWQPRRQQRYGARCLHDGAAGRRTTIESYQPVEVHHAAAPPAAAHHHGHHDHEAPEPVSVSPARR